MANTGSKLQEQSYINLVKLLKMFAVLQLLAYVKVVDSPDHLIHTDCLINQSLVYYTVDKPQPVNTSTYTIKT